MAFTTYTVTGNILDGLQRAGINLTRLAVYAEPSQEVINDASSNLQQFGNVPIVIEEDGTFVVELVETSETTLAGWTIVVVWRDQAFRSVETTTRFGPFPITANRTFGDILADGYLVLQPVDVETLESVYSARDDAQTAATVATGAAGTAAADAAAGAAAGVADQLEGYVDDAEAAKTAAEAAKVAAQAVGTTNDTVIASRLADSASASTAAANNLITAAQPWYVIKPTGTNDHLKIRDAVLAGHTNLELAEGTFAINGSMPALGTSYYGANTHVKIRGQGADKTILQMSATTQFGLSWRGDKTQIGGTNPISDVAAGATSLATGSDLTASFSVGDRFLVSSQAYFGSRSYHRVGEWAQVKAITASTITLTAPLRFSYVSANSIKLWKYTLLTGVEASGFSMLGHPSATVRQRPFWLQWCESPMVEGVLIDGKKIAVAFEVQECLGGVLRNCVTNNILDLGNSVLYTWEGYGCRTRGTLDFTVENLTGSNCKHLHDDSSFDNEPPATRTRVVGGVARDCVSSGWSTHGGSDELVWDGSTQLNCGGGFVARGRGAIGRRLVSDGVTNPVSDIYSQTFPTALPQSYKHACTLGENEDVSNTGGTASLAGVGLDMEFLKLDMKGGDSNCHGVNIQYAQLDDAKFRFGDVRLPSGGGSLFRARIEDVFQHAVILGRVTSNASDAKVVDIEPSVAGKAPQDVTVDLDVNGYNNQVVHIQGRATSGSNNSKDIHVTVRAQGKNAAYADTDPVVHVAGYFDSGSGALKIADCVLRESKKAAISTASANAGGSVGLAQARNVTSEGFDNTPLPDFAIVSGSYFFATSPTTAGTSSMAVGELRLTPTYLPRAVTITRLGAEVTTIGDAGSKFRLGIYADINGKPSTLMLDAGTVNGDSVSVQEITLGASLVLGPGWYWFGGVSQTVTTTAPTLRTVGTALGLLGGSGFLIPPNGTSIPTSNQTVVGYRQTGVTGALPATLTSLSSAGSAARLFFKTS